MNSTHNHDSYTPKRLAECKRLVLGGPRQDVFEHICAAVASDRALSVCYPSLMENRLAIGIPEGVHLAPEYWILGPSYVDRTNPLMIAPTPSCPQG